uniref:NBS-LRR disease resistance protein NBS44 n=1 Tax=Dimocarpus longan TaxID=128017 RepID=A0A0F6TMN5_9ROSI|nr:NBS-LRR disease resistance protein NBS44 [Dimocarpus longan]
MAVTDFFAGEIAVELMKTLVSISRKSLLCKGSADQLRTTIGELLPIIEEIKYSGVEVPANRQFQLDGLSRTLKEGQELCEKVQKSGRWNMYKNLMLSRKMEKLTKRVSTFLNGQLQAHVLADVHHMRFETTERFDRLEQRLGSLKIGSAGRGGWMEEAVKEVEMEEEKWVDGGFGNLTGMGIALGKKKVKEMVIEREDLGVVGISGIGGSGKTTLAAEVCRDGQVLSYFSNRILFLTVSQSPDVEQLRAKIWGFISGGCYDDIPLQFHCKTAARCLVVLDDVWSLSVLKQLIFEVPGYKTLVVSRFVFQTVVNASYKVELLRENESLLLFCQSAFGQRTIPPAANVNLVKQIVNECKGLPLALKVIGASLRGQPEMYWKSAQKRLSRGEPICESHESMLDRMAISIKYLPEKVRECFLDLGSFPEDKKIPLEVIINMWVAIHDIDAEEAFAILVQLAERNLLNLVKDARAGDMYSSYYEIFVAQHDVMRDLALHLSNRGNINGRKRLLMPNLDTELPTEWERHVDQPFCAQIVSIHIGEMSEMDWFRMEFPKAEVLILNFSSKEFFLPPFIANMPKLRALIIKNYSTFEATLHNFSVCSNLTNLRSLWLEKVSISQLPQFTAPLKKMQKISLALCKLNNSLDQPSMDLCQMFPCLQELTIDHCHDLIELPTSICKMQSLRCLSVTNCHSLLELPADIGMLRSLQILRLYACPLLRTLPPGICELVGLKYLNISQCLRLSCLPQRIGKLVTLEKIDMRECPQIFDLPKSVPSLQFLRCVICDEEIFWSWKDMVKSEVHVEVPERCFDLNWLRE